MKLFLILVVCISPLFGSEIVRKPLSIPGTAFEWGKHHQSRSAALATLQNNCIQIAGNVQNFSLALRSDGSVIAWGSNNSGQTNAPTTGVFTCIAAGWKHALAVRNDGTVTEWGMSQRFWPKQSEAFTKSITNAVTAVAGDNHSAVLLANGTVVTWGTRSSVTNKVSAWQNIIDLSSGWYHLVGLRQDGTLLTAGLGFAHSARKPDGNFIRVEAGMFHNLALRSDGTVAAWGDNTFGQCEMPKGLTNVVRIGAGRYHSMAVKQDGSVVSWGRNPKNDFNQFDIPSPLNGAKVLFAGGYASVHSQVIIKSRNP